MNPKIFLDFLQHFEEELIILHYVIIIILERNKREIIICFFISNVFALETHEDASKD